jgi:hypothetical protein
MYSFGAAAPLLPMETTWLRINEVYFGEDLEETSFKFIELRYLLKERNLPQGSKRPRMQAIDYRFGVWDLQTNRFKMLNYIVHNPINSDYIVYGYQHPEYPENINHLFNIVLDELPDKYDTVTGVILFSCVQNMDWDPLVLTALEDEIGKVVDDLLLDDIPEHCFRRWILVPEKVGINYFKQQRYKRWLGCSDDVEDNKIYCRVCKYFLDLNEPPEGIVIPSNPRDIAYKGVLGANKKTTRDYVHSHLSLISKGKPDATGIFHNEVIEYVENNEIDSTGVDATSKMFVLVYGEVKIPVTYEQHSTLVETVKYLGVGMGNHHFSKASAATITKYIDYYFHIKFLRKLVNSNTPFSILVDLSTSRVSGLHVLLVVIQYIDNDRPTLYLFGVYKSLETGMGMFDVFMDDITNIDLIIPGFKNFMKRNMMLFVSDGGSSVIGVRNSFYSRVRDWSDKRVPKNHCFNHRLALAWGKVIKEL